MQSNVDVNTRSFTTVAPPRTIDGNRALQSTLPISTLSATSSPVPSEKAKGFPHTGVDHALKFTTGAWTTPSA